TATSSAKAVSVQTTTYRPAHEIYSAFTAAFLNQISTSVQRIGLFDANNGFFIGFVGTTFGVTVRNGAADTFTSQGSFNVDTLLGNITSKFTRNGTPEAVNFGFSNLYRIRFAWLGSANILFEIFSPDGEWVLFHNIRQPNTSYNPSIQSPNLPMNLEVVKSSGANNVSIATACWGAGTTSAYSPISSTLTDNTLAAMTRSVITGVTTGGGGNYVNVKVNPSGALVTENTQSGTASQNIAQYGGVATTLGQKAMTASMPVVLASDQSAVSTNISQYGGTSTTLGQKAMSASMPVTIASDQSSLPTTTNINQYGGAAVSLGQKVMTASMPVVISSDQSNVNTLQPDVYITGAVTNLLNNNLILASAGSSSYDAAGYKSGSIQVVTAATSGNFTFEGSNDNTNFQVIPVFRNDLASPPAILTSITATASQFIYTFPIKFRYLRLRISSALNNNCQAFTKLSQESWSPTIPTVVQATGSNLNAVISGSLTSAGTVSQATASSLNCTAVVAGATLQAGATTDITSAALGAGTVNSNQVSTGSLQASSFAIYVTAVSGTPTYDIDVQETMDGTSYYTIYSFERITATGQYYSPVIKHSGSGLRYVRTVGGTTPSVTSSVVRVSRQGQAETMRRFINRTIVPNTLNSNTGSFFCDGVEDFNLIVRCTAQTTAATIALEFSHDNTNWFTSTASVTTAVGIVQAKIINEQWKFVRATVTAAGTGITLGEVTIGGHSA
ncbi:MAG: hypothetical protein EBX40_03775, partial [Gammaproteobacteria bacterium]|nr:hypothetical protein [Gammaproteobacteria bacterium]